MQWISLFKHQQMYMENRKTSPRSPCAPNLLHVLMSRTTGYHNLCSPANVNVRPCLETDRFKEHRGSPNNWASGNGWLNSVIFSNERLTSVTSLTHSFRDLSSSVFSMWRVFSGRKVFLEFCWSRRANAASIYWVCQKSQKQKWSPVQESTS